MKKYKTLKVFHHQIKHCRDLSLESKYSNRTGHSNAKKMCIFGIGERDGGTWYSLQDTSHTTLLFILPRCPKIHILLIQAIIQTKLQMHLIIKKITGPRYISSFGKKNVTIIMEQKSHNGKKKKKKNGLEKKRQKEQRRWQLIDSQKVGITEGRQCKQKSLVGLPME
uniref:Uncharacterized protein n=3 Tax=Canis lupus TaxID=9612 RepID=A0A8C0PJB3_CANLF